MSHHELPKCWPAVGRLLELWKRAPLICKQVSDCAGERFRHRAIVFARRTHSETWSRSAQLRAPSTISRETLKVVAIGECDRVLRGSENEKRKCQRPPARSARRPPPFAAAQRMDAQLRPPVYH